MNCAPLSPAHWQTSCKGAQHVRSYIVHHHAVFWLTRYSLQVSHAGRRYMVVMSSRSSISGTRGGGKGKGAGRRTSGQVRPVFQSVLLLRACTYTYAPKLAMQAESSASSAQAKVQHFLSFLESPRMKPLVLVRQPEYYTNVLHRQGSHLGFSPFGIPPTHMGPPMYDSCYLGAK